MKDQASDTRPFHFLQFLFLSWLFAGLCVQVAYAREVSEYTTISDAAPYPSIALSMNADIKKECLEVGDEYTYWLVAYNNGNTTLSDVIISELPEVFNGDGTLKPIRFVSADMGSEEGVLLPGEKATYYTKYIVQQADIDRGEISAQAQVSALSGEETVSDLSCQTFEQSGATVVKLCQNPSIAISLNAETKKKCLEVGDEYTYWIVVFNNGNTTLRNVGVTELLDVFNGAGKLKPIRFVAADMDSEEGVLLPGEQATYYTKYIVQQADIDRGEISAQAQVTARSGEEIVSDLSCQTFDQEGPTVIKLCQNRQLMIEKTAREFEQKIGNEVVFDVTVRNIGNVTLHEIYLEDIQTGDSWLLERLAPGATESRQASVGITQEMIDGRCFENTAFAEIRKYTEGGQQTSEYQVLLREEASTSVCFDNSPLIGIEKEADRSEVREAGEVVVYSLSVTNLGKVSLINIEVLDKLTGFSSFIPTLMPLEKVVLLTQYTVTQQDIDQGGIVNVATVKAQTLGNEPQLVEDSDQEIVNVSRNAAIQLVKTDNGAVVTRAGDKITYTLTATNTGNVTLVNVSIKDPQTELDQSVADLVPGASASVSTTYTVSQTDVDAGLVLNTAIASGEDPEGKTPSDETTEETPIESHPMISLEKVANLSSVSQEGVELVYTLTVTNTGNVTLFGGSLKDPKTGLDLADITLSPSESKSFQTSYTVTLSDLLNGTPIINTAKITASHPVSGKTVEAEAEAVVQLDLDADIEIQKTANVQEVREAGEVIQYSLKVRNTGSAPLLNLLVSDPLTGLQETLDLLLPGATVEFNTSYQVTMQDIVNQVGIKNVANVSAPNPKDPETPLEDEDEVTVGIGCEDGTLITGVVLNANDDTPLAGVPVILIPQASTSGEALMLVTGADGRYTFKDIVPGEYLVQVQDANLNAVKGLYPVESSLFFTIIEACKFRTHDFGYDTYDGVVLGDLVWYDLNGDGIQNEWFDADDDDQVTQNAISDQPISIKNWEWFDLNGDGRYDGPENEGELNKAGFGNDKSANISVVGPNGYTNSVIVGISGYWRTRPEAGEGEYTATLIQDEPFDIQASLMRSSGLVKNLPEGSGRVTEMSDGSRSEERCGTTTDESIARTVTPTETIFLDMDFGVRCLDAVVEIIANEDDFGTHFSSFGGLIGNILDNDLLEGSRPNLEDIEFEFVELDGIVGLLIDENGNLSLVPGVNPAGEYTLRYILREADYPDNNDDALIIIRIMDEKVDLTVTKEALQDEVFEGDVFDYEIVVSNVGVNSATDVVVSDQMPAGVAYQSFAVIENSSNATVSANASGNGVSFTIPVLGAGNSVTIHIRVKAEAKGTVVNTVVVGAKEDDENPEDNDADDETQIQEFRIPNVITPNSDRKNDAFEIRGLGKYASNSIKILNRYGDHVFERENYGNDWSASGQVSGTYYYVLRVVDAQGNVTEFKGWIQVIKD